MLNIDNAALVVVDIQGKLAQLMHEKEALFERPRGSSISPSCCASKSPNRSGRPFRKSPSC